MPKVFIEQDTLTAIGDAIRSKEGTTELVPVTAMATRITNLPSGGGGSEDVPEVVLTGSCPYACAGKLAGTFIEAYPNKISTNNISDATNMFYMNDKLTRVPFIINMKAGGGTMTSFFQSCSNLIESPTIDCKQTSYHNMDRFFNSCLKLRTVSPLLNVYPGNITQIFNSCSALSSIPDDFFSDWNFARLQSYTSANLSGVFSQCNSLRKLPTSLFEKLQDGWVATSTYSSLYNTMCNYCTVLDEIVNIPVTSGTYTSNTLSNMITYCNRLKRVTFATNEDGTPKTAKWKGQTLEFTQYAGWVNYSSNITSCSQYTGITADKEVKDDATYQALKNDPDWWTLDINYCRYNHDSAVETINSLPDTSAYLATAGGTNTIKFNGQMGSKTDGGAINTLTAEEIAVATAKGWTVTIS